MLSILESVPAQSLLAAWLRVPTVKPELSALTAAEAYEAPLTANEYFDGSPPENG